MVINLSNFGGGGGGGSYILPIASSEVLGGVKIGNGIDIDSAGTISVTGSTGGGIEVVTELPSSGTDGQTVLLETVLSEKIINITGTGNGNSDCVMTAIGLTSKTRFITFNFYNTNVDVYINTDHSLELYDSYTDTSESFSAGTSGETYTMNGQPQTNVLTLYVTDSGATIKFQGSTNRSNAITPVVQHREEKQVLYTWSDVEELTSDIDYTISTERPWCVRFKYSEIPSGTTLVVWKYSFGDDYRHLVYENGEIHSYQSDSADTYTATSYTNCSQYGYTNAGRDGIVYWTDDEVIVYSVGYSKRTSINTDAFYRTGWHKELEHKISNKAFYRDYIFYDGDYQIIVKNDDFKVYDVGLKINPNGQYNTPYRVYSKNSSDIGPIFAPTTTGTTGYVCVAGNGWAAPTWVAPETITNGVKFWKGTQDQYDALGTYDSSTLYIITDSNNAL